MTTTTFSADIARPVGHCSATGRELTPGEAYVAALVERPDAEEVERLDYSPEAWDSGARPEAPARLFAFWRSIVPEPGRKERPLIGDDEVMDLFEQLGESDDPSRRAFRYVLALLLVRRKKLVYEGGRPAGRGGGEGVLFVRPWVRKDQTQPPVIEVVDPGLDEATLASVTEQIGLVMNTDDE